MKPLIEGGDVVEPLRERVLGRVVCEDVMQARQRKTCYYHVTRLLGRKELRHSRRELNR